ncbi:MAG TPA: C4-type zinc ribbon domain-containing protein [Spirochaetota bacterium]|nr:C4-type zinc ribbon domain-containing protein [Spirochaetota bacterium]HOS41489.1 C4-type zinc ribbon domain-containing protein [Spirochaetota bacterium]HPU88525.1 C4-type zinc ribbon domain-containing protein [Spirochaetota bacterium]
MNKEIIIMIELQRHWDAVVRARADRQSSEREIADTNAKISAYEKEVNDAETGLKALKTNMRQLELELKNLDETVSRLESRQAHLKTEKELDALNAELSRAKSDRGNLEESLIAMIDEIAENELALGKSREGLAALRSESEAAIERLRERILRFDALGEEHRGQFAELLTGLSPPVRVRFQKMTESASGVALARIDGSSCGVCHFELPPYLVTDAGRDDKIATCINCGRYLFIAAPSR